MINFVSIVQSDSGRRVNILEDHGIGHCEKSLHKHVSNSDWLPIESSLNPPIQKHFTCDTEREIILNL